MKMHPIEIDEKLLTGKYSVHRDIIDMYFDSMMSDADEACFFELGQSHS